MSEGLTSDPPGKGPNVVLTEDGPLGDRIPTSIATIPSLPSHSRSTHITEQDYHLLREGDHNLAQRWSDALFGFSTSALLGLVGVLASMPDPVAKVWIVSVTLLAVFTATGFVAALLLRAHAKKWPAERKARTLCIQRIEHQLGVTVVVNARTPALPGETPKP